MEDEVGMSELMETIFGKKPTIPEEIAAHSSSPASVLTKDFSKKIEEVLHVRKRVVAYRWADIFDQLRRGMLSSHALYLMFGMFTCVIEHEYNQNIFDSFISVCALVIYFSEEMLEKTEVDFRDLNPDIVIVFYRYVLQKPLLKRKEFNRFVEYIREHKYLKCDSDMSDLTLSDDPSAYVSLELGKKTNKKLKRYWNRMLNADSAIAATGMSLAQEVLSNTSVELPTLPDEPDLVMKLVASRRKELAKKAKRKRKVAALTVETSHGNSSSDYKTNSFMDQQWEIARHENIIQAVIRHNHSKSLDHGNTNNQIAGDAEGGLEHLKNKIKCLIEVLDECESK